MKKLILICFLSVSFVNAQVVSLTDSKSREAVNYEVISGLPIDAVLDGVLFAKKDGVIYKRVNNGVVKASWFGVKGDGITDDTENLQKFFSSIAYSKAQRFIVDGEKIKISREIYIHPLSNIEIDFQGSLYGNVVSGLFVNPLQNAFNVRIKNINIVNMGNPDLGISIGVAISDLVSSSISFGTVMGFEKGVIISSVLSNGGFSYNTVDFGFFHDNKVNVFISPWLDGYVNENTFNGGSFNHSSNYPDVETVNLLIDVDSSNMNMVNNNKFNYPSFEDNNSKAIAAKFDGVFNTINLPRMENPNNEQTYKIIMGSNSQYNNVIGGRGVYRANIEDTGNGNSFSAVDGDQISINGTVGNVYRNPYSDNSNVLTFQSNTSPYNELGSISAGGFFKGQNAYFENGVNFMSTDGSKTDRGIYGGIGVPTIVKANGSIYLDSQGSTGTTMYVRENGVWVAK